MTEHPRNSENNPLPGENDDQGITSSSGHREATDESEQPPDQEMLRQFLLGDGAAVEQVQTWIREFVYFKFRGLMPELDDISQATITGIWRYVSADGFSLRKSFRGLVRRIALAGCVDAINRNSREELVDDMDEEIDSRLGHHEQLEKSDIRQQVRKILRQLDKKCKQLILEHHYHGLTYIEMGERWQLAASTIGVMMFNCLNKIRKQHKWLLDEF